MGIVYTTGAGGGTGSSDECSVTAGEVLKGNTYIGADTDDEVGTGTLELTGNAAAGSVLSGKTFYNTNAKNRITGSIPSKAAATITPGTGPQTIAAGQYLSGIQTIDSLGGNAAAGHVLSGYSFSSNTAGRGIGGTMANRGAANHTLTINGSYTIPAGYHNGSGKVTQSIATFGAQTVTPNTAVQTVSTAGKYGTGNITVNPIPSNFYNINQNQSVFLNGVFGTVVNHGWRRGICSTSFLSYDEAIPNTPTISGSEIGFSVTYSKSSVGMFFNGSIELTPFSKLQAVVRVPSVPNSEASLSIWATSTVLGEKYSDYIYRCTNLARKYQLLVASPNVENTHTLTLDISNVMQKAYIGIDFSCGSAAGCRAFIQSITLIK